MQNDAIPASPNLDSLVQHRPACKRAVIRLLWPKIKASLDVGHTAREVFEKLRLDGIELSYPSLCRYVAELRRTEATGLNNPTATALPGKIAESLMPMARDPLANVRRLTQEKPPGFRYSGTMSEKELFGE